jgi:hypothetical protein
MVCIFDLDGTLADNTHRHHLVDPSTRDDCVLWMSNTLKETWVYREGWEKDETRKKFKPNWDKFNEDCDKDQLIVPVQQIFLFFAHRDDSDVRIWSGRSESVRDKTKKWLADNRIFGYSELRMRPIGDSTPDDQLKEKWLDEYLALPIYPSFEKDMLDGTILRRRDTVEFVFDDRPKVVRMWRRRGIFVFNVCQHDKEF